MPLICKQTQKNDPPPSEKSQKQNTYEYVSYVDLIRRPPKEHSTHLDLSTSLADYNYRNYRRSSLIQSQKNQELEKTLKNENNEQNEKKWLWSLNIEEMLKIPHRQFLIFFEEHEKKIIGLTTPDELKRLK